MFFVCIDVVASIGCYQTVPALGRTVVGSCSFGSNGNTNFTRCATVTTTVGANTTTSYACATSENCTGLDLPNNTKIVCCSTNSCNNPNGGGGSPTMSSGGGGGSPTMSSGGGGGSPTMSSGG